MPNVANINPAIRATNPKKSEHGYASQLERKPTSAMLVVSMQRNR